MNVSPTSTTTYFVRVSGCSTFVDSNAVTVTVQCQNPAITLQPASTSIISGGNTLLTDEDLSDIVIYLRQLQSHPDR